MNLDLTARHPEIYLRRSFLAGRLSGVSWNKAAFVALWEGQSHVSSLAYVALVAFTSIWVAFGAMFIWSVAATVFFCAARERGYPNLLTDESAPKRRAGSIAAYAIGSLFRAWLAGINAFIYARCCGALITQKQGCCRMRRLARFGAIAVGLTLFGVTSAEHMLRKAGYSGRNLVRMTLIGPFLHVPYRVLVSAAVVALLTDVLKVFPLQV